MRGAGGVHVRGAGRKGESGLMYMYVKVVYLCLHVRTVSLP